MIICDASIYFVTLHFCFATLQQSFVNASIFCNASIISRTSLIIWCDSFILCDFWSDHLGFDNFVYLLRSQDSDGVYQSFFEFVDIIHAPIKFVEVVFKGKSVQIRTKFWCTSHNSHMPPHSLSQLFQNLILSSVPISTSFSMTTSMLFLSHRHFFTANVIVRLGLNDRYVFERITVVNVFSNVSTSSECIGAVDIFSIIKMCWE